MARRKHRPEQVIKKLRQAEVAMAEGSTVAASSRTDRWTTGHGRRRPSCLRRLF